MGKSFIPPLLMKQSAEDIEKMVRWNIRKDIEKCVKPAVKAAKGINVDPSSFRTTDPDTAHRYLNRFGGKIETCLWFSPSPERVVEFFPYGVVLYRRNGDFLALVENSIPIATREKRSVKMKRELVKASLSLLTIGF